MEETVGWPPSESVLILPIFSRATTAVNTAQRGPYRELGHRDVTARPDPPKNRQ